jgi:NitT/TauT family transport system permease protein/taurine transport system permease protein
MSSPVTETAVAERPPPVGSARSDSLLQRLGRFRGVLPFAALGLIWWGVIVVFDPAPTVLVPPDDVVAALWSVLIQGELLAFLQKSLGRLFSIQVLIFTTGGLVTGWVLGLNRELARVSEPILRFFNAVSGIAWLPLIILWFGFTETTITAIIVYTMSFPIIFNAMVGVRTVPDRLRDASLTLGAGRLRVMWDVYLPGSFPSVMTGLRLGIGFGWRALIAGEFVIGGGGLGFLIFNARTVGNIAEVMAGMIVLGTLWLALDRLILRPVEEHVNSRWGMVRI